MLSQSTVRSDKLDTSRAATSPCNRRRSDSERTCSPR